MTQSPLRHRPFNAIVAQFVAQNFQSIVDFVAVLYLINLSTLRGSRMTWGPTGKCVKPASESEVNSG